MLITDDDGSKRKYSYYCDGKTNDGHYAEVGWHDTAEEAKNDWNARKENIDERSMTAFEIVAVELGKAKGKHPKFAETTAHGVCIINEELGELAASINDDESKSRQIEEAAHVAVTAIRFIENML